MYWKVNMSKKTKHNKKPKEEAIDDSIELENDPIEDDESLDEDNEVNSDTRIEELESKFSKDFNESTFNEIKELKKLQKIN